jgi:hypothetical protein
MRILAIVALLGGTAAAGPVVRGGAVGGYDTAAPGHHEDGLALGLGYRYDGLTAELDYAYLDYDGSTGVGGNTQRIGALGQAKLFSFACHPGGEVCPHMDLDVGAARRTVHWTPAPNVLGAPSTSVDRAGRELRLGVSANFGLHLALHYVLFQPDDPMPAFSCRGSCPMRVSGDDRGVLLEASFVWGG